MTECLDNQTIAFLATLALIAVMVLAVVVIASSWRAK
jgi:hypothetical protein